MKKLLKKFLIYTFLFCMIFSASLSFTPHSRFLPNGCDFYFDSQKLCATLSLTEDKNLTEPDSFKLYFWNKEQGNSQQAVIMDPEAFQIALSFKNPNGNVHYEATALHATAESEQLASDGKYEVKYFNFNVPGEWKIKAKLIDQNGKSIDESMTSYTVQ